MNKSITLLILGVIFLALLLMVVNSFLTDERQSAPVAATDRPQPQDGPLLAPSAPDASGSAALGTPAPKAAPQRLETAAAESAPTAEGVAGKTLPAQIDPGQKRAADAPPARPLAPTRPSPPKVPVIPEPKPAANPPPNAKPAGGGVKNIANSVILVTQEGATLRLPSEAPLECKPTQMRNPERLVLDCAGQWNMTVPSVPQNKIIKAIRVGRQADSTRIVIDLHRALTSHRLSKTTPNGLDVRLR
ncbi:MAG: AMIN domain-containing protein [Deltaproteobacteria bacterium]|jgi:hypothetical protein|nr:AMIN domain-containing protein [Deltaproteobacteria bacterium]